VFVRLPATLCTAHRNVFYVPFMFPWLEDGTGIFLRNVSIREEDSDRSYVVSVEASEGGQAR
jgi:hypothetical protein